MFLDVPQEFLNVSDDLLFKNHDIGGFDIEEDIADCT